MYSEQNEEVARRAYDLYAKTIPRCPLGELYAGKHRIRDLVNAPDRTACHTSIANAMEGSGSPGAGECGCGRTCR